MAKSNRYFLLLLVVLFLFGCSPSQSIIQTAISGTQTAIQTNLINNIITATPTPAPLPTSAPSNTPNSVNLSSLYSTIKVNNFCEFQVNEINFSKKILPPNTNGFYTYYEAKSPDSIFLDIVINIKNLDTIIRSVDDLVSVSVVYDNQYTYQATPIVVDADGSFTYPTISGVQPLLSKIVYYLITIPTEIQNSNKSLVIIFYSGENEYYFNYR